jgi:hypothetical protein
MSQKVKNKLFAKKGSDNHAQNRSTITTNNNDRGFAGDRGVDDLGWPHNVDWASDIDMEQQQETENG